MSNAAHAEPWSAAATTSPPASGYCAVIPPPLRVARPTRRTTRTVTAILPEDRLARRGRRTRPGHRRALGGWPRRAVDVTRPDARRPAPHVAAPYAGVGFEGRPAPSRSPAADV